MVTEKITRKIMTTIETIEPDGSVHLGDSTFKITKLTDVTKSNMNKLNRTVGAWGMRFKCAFCGEGLIFGVAKESSEHPQWMHESTKTVSKDFHNPIRVVWDESQEVIIGLQECEQLNVVKRKQCGL